MPYNITIAGGGTGGHVFPAIAIADALKIARPGISIHFIGAKNRIEMTKVPEAGYSISGLDIGGLNRKQWLKNISLPFKLFSAVRASISLIQKHKAIAVIGVGGYASGPALIAALWCRIPIFLQEQNSYPGVTNRYIARFARKCFVAYEGLSKYFPVSKILMTGNPVRKEIEYNKTNREEALQFFNLNPNKKTLLVIGGSLGARTINHSIKNGIDQLIEADVQIIWQTGKLYFGEMENAAKGRAHMHVSDFIRRMDLAYQAADVIVSRAGALSISELTFVGKPVVLIPSPNVAEDHQTKNAMSLVNKEAAILVTDKDAASYLVERVISLLADEGRMKSLASNIIKLSKPEAAKNIADEILKSIQK